MKLDILAIGVHPDDVELGCAGTILKNIKQGKQIGILDLTRGELGTRGTPEQRLIEATDAAKILGVHTRENLELKDGFFENNEETLKKIITVIRKYQPEIVLCNAVEDRHPDHGRSAKLTSDACFLSGLRKIETTLNGETQKEWRPKYIFHYIQDRFLQPNFVFDISDEMETKLESVLAYKSQFHNPDWKGEPQTYISSPEFLETIKARAMMLGKRIGVKYAEGYLSEKMIGIDNFDSIIQNVT